jgi:MtN3 and saliva related transmembrane protein
LGESSELEPMTAEWLGWASSAILLATLIRQVYTQWRQRTVAGVSHWLFIGQLAASTGFLIYSVLVDNWVFVFTNAALLITAIVGQLIYLRNTRAQSRQTGPREANPSA